MSTSTPTLAPTKRWACARCLDEIWDERPLERQSIDPVCRLCTRRGMTIHMVYQGDSIPFQADPQFINQYIETALWASNPLDVPDEPPMCVGDLAPETLAAMRADCHRFCHLMKSYIAEENLEYRQDDDYLGAFAHDFWLTRNREGAGYWDGDYVEPAASVLTRCAHDFGEFTLYYGDADGTGERKIYHTCETARP